MKPPASPSLSFIFALRILTVDSDQTEVIHKLLARAATWAAAFLGGWVISSVIQHLDSQEDK